MLCPEILTSSFAKKIVSVVEDFGQTFFYRQAFYGYNNDQSVTIEPEIEGTLDILINNDCVIYRPHREISQKAQSLVHYTWEKSQHYLLLTDIQGVGYELTDPEIATAKGYENNKLNFCAGNLADTAIMTFQTPHACNEYCLALKLENISFKPKKTIRKSSDLLFPSPEGH